MKKHFIQTTFVLFFLTIFTATSIYAQISVRKLLNTAKTGGRIAIGNERLNDDYNSETTMGVYGFGTDTYRVGGWIHFGDYGSLNAGSGNVAIGEYGGTDSDNLQLHGRTGISFTYNAGWVAGAIQGDGRLTWYSSIHATNYTTSDIKLKTNIKKMEGAASLTLLKQLNGINYDLINRHAAKNEEKLNQMKPMTEKEKETYEKAKADIAKNKVLKNQFGFSAQEVQKLLPNVVDTDDEGYLSVNYTAIIPHLVEAMKAQQDIIESLQKEISAIKVKVGMK